MVVEKIMTIMLVLGRLSWSNNKRRFKCTVFSDHPLNRNPIRPLDPVARGLWDQCGILQDYDTLGTELTTGLWVFHDVMQGQFD